MSASPGRPCVMCGSDGSADSPGCAHCRKDSGEKRNVMIGVRSGDRGEEPGAEREGRGNKGPPLQHVGFIVLGLAMIAGFAWLCTSDYEFGRYSLRFVFSHPYWVGFILLPISVIHIFMAFGKKFYNQYGRDYTHNYLGWIVLIMALGFIAYGLTRPPGSGAGGPETSGQGPGAGNRGAVTPDP